MYISKFFSKKEQVELKENEIKLENERLKATKDAIEKERLRREELEEVYARS